MSASAGANRMEPITNGVNQADLRPFIRVLKVQVCTVTRTASVVVELISKERIGGRPGTKARIEYTFETDETKTSLIGAHARKVLLERFKKAHSA